jgi:hypothetical protein
MKFIKSRKFVATVAGVVTVIANEAFGMKLDNESVVSIVALIMTYVLGQSHVDSKNGVDK